MRADILLQLGFVMYIVHHHGRHDDVSAMTYDAIHMMMMMMMMTITDLLQLLNNRSACVCTAGRHFAGTAMNAHSSRSHVIFRIVSIESCIFTYFIITLTLI